MAKHETTRGGVSRDAAGIGPHARPGVQLTPMKELHGVDVAEGDADIRGWVVRTLGGRELGKVSDLLVDVEAGEVVMLDIDLAGTDRHTLAPARAAQVDRIQRVVLLDSGDLEDAGAVPALQRGAALTDADAQQFSTRYEQAYGDRGWDRDRDFHVNRGQDRLHFRGPTGATADRAEQKRAVERAELEAYDENAERDRERQRQAQSGQQQKMRFPQNQEIVVERRPVIEEVVVRRRVVEADSPEARRAAEEGGTEAR
jgi:hypothetical protein